MTKKNKVTSFDDSFFNSILEGLFRRKAKEIIEIDLKDLENAICSKFLICHGDSNMQVRAIADSVEEKILSDCKQPPWHKEGYENLQWILLDYGEIIVHIFQKTFRDYYNIEELWADGNITKHEEDVIKKRTKKNERK